MPDHTEHPIEIDRQVTEYTYLITQPEESPLSRGDLCLLDKDGDIVTAVVVDFNYGKAVVEEVRDGMDGLG